MKHMKRDQFPASLQITALSNISSLSMGGVAASLQASAPSVWEHAVGSETRVSDT
jgi:hypothetical protein